MPTICRTNSLLFSLREPKHLCVGIDKFCFTVVNYSCKSLITFTSAVCVQGTAVGPWNVRLCRRSNPLAIQRPGETVDDMALETWLRDKLAEGSVPGLQWTDKHKRQFRLPEKHLGRHHSMTKSDYAVYTVGTIYRPICFICLVLWLIITSLPKVIWEEGRVAAKVSPHWLQRRAPNSPPKVPLSVDRFPNPTTCLIP